MTERREFGVLALSRRVAKTGGDRFPVPRVNSVRDWLRWEWTLLGLNSV